MTKAGFAIILAICSSSSIASGDITPNCSDPCACVTPTQMKEIVKKIELDREVARLEREAVRLETQSSNKKATSDEC